MLYNLNQLTENKKITLFFYLLKNKNCIFLWEIEIHENIFLFEAGKLRIYHFTPFLHPFYTPFIPLN